jgi:hypothetical protein
VQSFLLDQKKGSVHSKRSVASLKLANLVFCTCTCSHHHFQSHRLFNVSILLSSSDVTSIERLVWFSAKATTTTTTSNHNRQITTTMRFLSLIYALSLFTAIAAAPEEDRMVELPLFGIPPTPQYSRSINFWTCTIFRT